MWTEEEAAVLIVFSMWGYKHEAIAEILTNRRAEIRGIVRTDMPPSYTRTVPAVRNKLAEIRTQNPQLWSKNEGWARDAVLAHLYGSLLDHDHVNRLLNLTSVDIKTITRVCVPNLPVGRLLTVQTRQIYHNSYFINLQGFRTKGAIQEDRYIHLENSNA